MSGVQWMMAVEKTEKTEPTAGDRGLIDLVWGARR